MDNFSIARPYVKAILDVAEEGNTYLEWDKMLNFLSAVVSNSDAQSFLNNMVVTGEEKINFFCEVGSSVLNNYGENLIRTLVQAKRVLLLPVIYCLYKEMLQVVRSELDVNLLVAQQSSQDLKVEFSDSIPGEQVGIKEQVSPELIAGGVARIGNKVVDGSYKGQLASLREFIVSE